MSNCPWLPPLNVPGRPTQTSVKICQAGLNGSDQSLQYPTLYCLRFHASVDFVSNSKDSSTRQENFPGLVVQNHLHVTCACYVVDEILCCLPSIDSDENRVIFAERFLHEEEYRSSELYLGGQELFHKIDRFMHDVSRTRLYHINENVFFFELKIRMEIVIPDDELKSWHSWFDAKVASDPNFMLVYARAILRPRTVEELLAEDVKTIRSGSARFEVVEVDKTSAQSCSICLDEVLAGCKAIKLPCDHMFHENCITKWLQENCVCPLCRFDVQSSIVDEHTKQ